MLYNIYFRRVVKVVDYAKFHMPDRGLKYFNIALVLQDNDLQFSLILQTHVLVLLKYMQ